MDWIPTYTPPTFNSTVSPGNMTDPGELSGTRIDPRLFHVLTFSHFAAQSSPGAYKQEYWAISGASTVGVVSTNLAIAYTNATDAETEYDRLLAILQVAADAGDPQASGSTTTTVTIPEFSITAESGPAS